jgi:hypothetical protein
MVKQKLLLNDVIDSTCNCKTTLLELTWTSKKSHLEILNREMESTKYVRYTMAHTSDDKEPAYKINIFQAPSEN